MPQDLSTTAVADLLGGYAQILAELRRRQVVRSNNAPTGDYAEWLCAEALRGRLVDNFSVKSYDLTLPAGERVQVKCRMVSDPPKTGQLQTMPFRSWEFDLAALVLLRSVDYSVLRAALIPVAVVREAARFAAHVNGSNLQMRASLFEDPQAQDITAALRAAAMRHG